MGAYGISKGRRYEEREDVLMGDPFLDDKFKILQSKAYRRLAYKTQVVTTPDNPHIRTRLAHTNEVMAVSMLIAKNLNLNVSLCEAIAAGHDIGHAPYGHYGEDFLTRFGGKEFRHNVNGVVIMQHVERRGKGLNLAYETLEGMLNHAYNGEQARQNPEPQEYAVIRIADQIAYTFSDLNDAIIYNYLKEDKLPECALKLGNGQRQRLHNSLRALISESREKDKIEFRESKEAEYFRQVTEFMLNEVYRKINHSIHDIILGELCRFFSDNENALKVNPVLLVSLLTDSEANAFGELLIRSKDPSLEQIKNFGIFEILPYIQNKKIDYTDSDL